jgi:hypothetical protein
LALAGSSEWRARNGRARHPFPKTGLRVTFERCGHDGVPREHDSQVAATPERALKTAILMLAGLDNGLVDGDRLTVKEVGEHV